MLEKIVTALEGDIPFAVIIALHMDEQFLKSFARRLGRINGIEVVFVQKRDEVVANKIYLLADTSRIFQELGRYFIVKEDPPSGYYHPTIDSLFCSAAHLKGVKIDAYLLSGIGSDGAKGLLSLKGACHFTVAQDEASSIVYGMPKSAFEIGAAKKIMGIDAIVKEIQGKG